MKKLLLLIAIVSMVSCKKKTTEPEPTPTTGGTTGTPAVTTKTVSFAYYQSGTFGANTGTVELNFTYDYAQPYANSTWYSVPSSTVLNTKTQVIPVEADSMVFNLQLAPGGQGSNYFLNYTVSINGVATQTANGWNNRFIKY